MKQKDNFFIITGGPGVGKTTLLEELERKGFHCVPEVARNIIKEQVAGSGSALPWSDAKKYSELMLEYSIRDFENLKDTIDTRFFDRGIPDTYGYEMLMKFEIDERLKRAVDEYRYNDVVFILPPWREIYETDSERKQDFEEAVRTYTVMREAYLSIGYTLVEVPLTNVTERAEFVLKRAVRK